MYCVSTFITLIDNRWHHDMYRVLTINCQPSSIGEINLCYQNYISTGNYETEANLLIVNCSMDIMIISGSECLHYAYAHTDSILNFPSLGWQDRDQDTSRTCDLGPVPTGACVCGHGVSHGHWSAHGVMLLHHCQQLQVFIALVTLLHVTNIT